MPLLFSSSNNMHPGPVTPELYTGNHLYMYIGSYDVDSYVIIVSHDGQLLTIIIPIIGFNTNRRDANLWSAANYVYLYTIFLMVSMATVVM